MKTQTLLRLALVLLVAGVYSSSLGYPAAAHGKGQLSSSGTLHRLIESQANIQAVDICFVMSAEDTMHQRWMQYLATSIDNELMSRGIGLAEEARNLFCAVQFGAKGKEMRATLLSIKNKVFFRAHEVPAVRRTLKRNGFSADGYEAIEFALNNVPFRNSSEIAKSIILGANTGRSTLSDKANLTKSFIFQKLKKSNVTLDVVVNVTLQEEDQHTSVNQSHTFLGLVDYSHGVLLDSGGKEFPVVSDKIVIASSHGTTISDYVALAFESGGSAWAMGFFCDSSFDPKDANAVAQVYVENRWYVQSNVCQVCSWEENSTEVCFQPQNQRLCKQCANNTTKNCSTYQYQESQGALRLTASVNIVQEQEEAVVSFSSNQGGIAFKCTYLQSRTKMMTLPCASPLVLQNLSSGYHQVVVAGQTHDGVEGVTLVEFSFEEVSDPLQVTISGTTTTGSDSVSVAFSANHRSVQFKCSVTPHVFTACGSPFEMSLTKPMTFTVVAIDSRGDVDVAMATIEPVGPLSVTVTGSGVDPFGVVWVSFKPSHSDSWCNCFIDPNKPPKPCNGMYKADPRVLGPGTYELVVACYDSRGYNTHTKVKFSLQEPPLISSGPLDCGLQLLGPFSNGSIVANFSCNREFSGSCQIASLPSHPCTNPFIFDSQSLAPGNHIFKLVAVDSFDFTSTIIEPFFVGPYDRKCCPGVINSSSSFTRSGKKVDLSVATTIGSCSVNEGFSYAVSWGDGSSVQSTFITHSPSLHLTNTYNSPGNYNVKVKYCNNPITPDNVCCSSTTLAVSIPHAT